MNSIFLRAAEVNSHGEVIVQGERAQFLLERHGLTVGLKLAAAVEGRGRGRCRIVECSTCKLVGHFELEEAVLPRTAIKLAVAVPRPQTIKKLLELAAMLGLEELCFFRSDLCQANYLQSKQLRSKLQQISLLNGLEQAWDSEFPRIRVLSQVDELLNDAIPLLVADTYGNNFTGEASSNPLVRLFVGPERGWSQRERDLFKIKGAQFWQLGPRMLRVEVAVAVAVGALGVSKVV